jgi:putative transposase
MTGKHTHADDARDERRLVAVDPGSARPVAVPEQLAGRVDELVGRFAEQMHQGLMAASVAIGLEVLDELMAAEVTELAGPKGKHDPGRTHKRTGVRGRLGGAGRPEGRGAPPAGAHRRRRRGGDAGHVRHGARHRPARRAHARSGARRPVDAAYPAALEPVGDEMDERASGTSKSAVSRTFVHATTERLAELMARPLDDQRWVIVYADGFTFATHQLVGALGVTDDGTKVPLAVVEGTTENATLVRRLLADLADRGLDASKGVLFVVDGSKALSSAIPAVFGGKAVIGRCRLHKERNVLDHLPDAEHHWVRRKLRAAWTLDDADAAAHELEMLARALKRKHPGAATSLHEGLDETLTVTRLGVTGALRKTVFSTNPVESMIQIVRDHAANVKRWRDGQMALRWAAAGMECARQQFRRVKGYRQLPELARRLEAATADEPGTLDLRVTA